MFFFFNDLLSVHRHAPCCLISQLKWSASKAHVCFIRPKISQLFVVVCSRKKRNHWHEPTWLGSCQCCNYLHHFDALQGFWRLDKRNLADRKRHETCYMQANNKCLSIIVELVNVPYIHRFIRVAVKHIHTSTESVSQAVAPLRYKGVDCVVQPASMVAWAIANLMMSL